MLERALLKPLLRSARRYPIVTVTGPRQSGKTTLVKAAFPRHAYANLEEPDQRTFAREDPRGFLSQYSDSVILDEVQQVPTLLSYIQTLADAKAKPGRFVLTGSQNLLLLQSVSQSLAGRTAVLHLLPLSYSELKARKPLALAAVGKRTAGRARVTRDSVFDILWSGLYPRIHDRKIPAHDWLANYYQTYVERDVRTIINVGDLETFSRFVRLCAGRSGQLVNTVSLGNDCGVSHATVQRWLSMLEATFVITLLRPYHNSFNKRLIKAPKLHFIDSGLLCYLLNVRSPRELQSHASRGAVFESFVVSEFLKMHWHAGMPPQLFFWRDSSDHEVDLIIERGAQPVAIEIKSAATIASDFFSGLVYWRALKPSNRACGLIYTGQTSFARLGNFAYPWSTL